MLEIVFLKTQKLNIFFWIMPKTSYKEHPRQNFQHKKLILLSYTGCRYKGIINRYKGLMDKNLPTLDFSKSGFKDVHGLLHVASGVATNKITCEIENSTSFLNDHGEWVALSDISDVLLISVQDAWY